MPDIIKLIDSASNELTSYYEVSEWVDGTTMDDSKVDGVIYRKRGGIYYRRAFTGPVNVKWFGAKGDGVTDDTVAFQKALDYIVNGKETLLLDGGYNPYVIKDLIIPNGVKIEGGGGSTNLVVNRDSSGNFIPSISSTKIKVPSGSIGFICQNIDGNRGGSIKNIVFVGEEDSLIGLKISGTSWEIDHVSAILFTNGIGFECGNFWRGYINKLQVRRCGIGLHINGTDGPINDIHFDSLLAENCRIGVYQTSTPGGSGHYSNTFSSPVIENICLTSQGDVYSIPESVTIPQDILDNTATTLSTLCGGVITSGVSEWSLVSPYFEAIDGVHIYAGTNSNIGIIGGRFSQGNALATVELNYRGALTMTYAGIIRLYGGTVTYNADATVYTSPVFISAITRSSIYQSIRFSTYSSGDRKLYGASNGSDIYTNVNRWSYGWYEDGYKLKGLYASDFFKSRTFVTDTVSQSITNTTTNLDLSAIAGGNLNLNFSVDDGTLKVLNFLWTDRSNCIAGQQFCIKLSLTLSGGSSVNCSFSTNIDGNSLYLHGLNETQVIFIDMVFGSDNRWKVKNIYLDNKKAQEGNTSGRPSVTTIGYQYFDTDLSKPIYWSGTDWVDATGTTV